MTFTFSSLITTLFFNVISISLLYLILKSNVLIIKAGIRVLFITIFISTLHLLIPFEFAFTKAIPVSNIWPYAYRFFTRSLITFGNATINMVILLFLVWIIGTIYFIIKNSLSYLHTVKKINDFDEANPFLKDTVEKIASDHKIKNRFAIVKSDSSSMPMIMGLLEPTIIVPDIRLTDREWYFILSHEIAHYIHRDILVKFLLEFFRAFYWWNPLVYLLKNQASRLMEMNVDNNLIKNWEVSEKLEYIECLVKLSKRQYLIPAIDLSAEFVNNNISVAQRAKLILDNIEKKNKQSVFTAVLVFSFFMMIMLMPTFFVFEAYYISPEYEEVTFVIDNENSYYIENDDGTYDFYLNGEYMVTQNEVIDTKIKIYQNNEEVPK